MDGGNALAYVMAILKNKAWNSLSLTLSRGLGLLLLFRAAPAAAAAALAFMLALLASCGLTGGIIHGTLVERMIFCHTLDASG